MTNQFLRTEEQDGILIVTFQQTVSGFADDLFLNELREVGSSYSQGEYKGMVIDFNQIPYFGSSVLEGLFVIWEKVKEQGTKLVMCNLSPVGLDILKISRFDTLWDIHKDREQAVAAIQE